MGDPQPLLAFYNDLTKLAPIRIAKHRSKIIDLTFTDKYLPGKRMPAGRLQFQATNAHHPPQSAAEGVHDGG